MVAETTTGAVSERAKDTHNQQDKRINSYETKERKMAKVAFLLLIVYFLKGAFVSFYDNTRLGRSGVPFKAVLSSEIYEGARRRGPGKYYYEFQIDNITYKGSAEKEKGVYVGDTINIFFLESNPVINCSYEYAKGIFFQKLIDKK